MEIAGHVVPPWRLAAAGLYLALGAAVIVVVWPGRQARPAAPFAPPSPASALRFPAPPSGATVFAREAGAEVLAAALTKVGPSLHVQVSIVGAQGEGAAGRAVTVSGIAADACGAGCYRAVVPASATVPITTGGATWRLAVPASSPGAALVSRAGRAWRSLGSVAWRETLGSDATHVVRSQWKAQAPDRVAYVVEKGGASVVIGNRRWDRTGDGPWRRGTQDPPLRQPVPFWTRATNARVVARSAGNATVTFYDPGTPGWFRIVVDTRTGRTLRLDMVATAHFMHDQYERFDASPVVPPR